jgi:hypothetical protein
MEFVRDFSPCFLPARAIFVGLRGIGCVCAELNVLVRRCRACWSEEGTESLAYDGLSVH